MTKKNKIGVIGTISLCVFSILILTAQVTRTTAALEVANTWSALQTFADYVAIGSGATVTSSGSGGTMASESSALSTATNFGTSLTPVTVISSAPSTGVYVVNVYSYLATQGSGCNAVSNTANLYFTYTLQPNGVGPLNTDPAVTFSITGNGLVGSNQGGSWSIAMEAGASLTLNSTSTLASTCSTTTPQYIVYAKAIY